ncbi:hypothetical protein BDZ89DRAFT_957440 [Hymenopellis radicata]|nr:hypothetical protein BDZ89DRAFT_957440 [Hymenopellis radicata]
MYDDIAGTFFNGHYVPTHAEKMAYQHNLPETWESSVRYGYYGMYLMAAMIFIAILFNLHFRWTQRRRLSEPRASQTLTLADRAYAIFRYIGYPRLPTSVNRFIAPFYTSSNRANFLLLLAGFIFTTLYCFAVTNYYRPPFYGSPPLGLRSEWLAMATLPFLIVFAQKINIVAVVIGTSHEKMQVLHQGVAGLHFYMSFVHTISMTIQRGMPWDWANNSIFWTGYAAFVPLVWLCFASLPIFRKAGYEFFWFFHLIAVGAYFGFLWIHVWQYLDGPYYMYATFAVFAWGVVLRLGYMIYVNLRSGVHRARVELLPSGTISIRIHTTLGWTPGQHVFLRFPTVRPLESHPFSISSIPQGARQPNEMCFLIAPQRGFTGSLKKKCEGAGRELDLPVLLDGPFGHSRPELRAFDSALLVAGGSGIAYILPLFVDLIQCLRTEACVKSRCTTVELLWAVPARGQSFSVFSGTIRSVAPTDAHVEAILKDLSEQLPDGFEVVISVFVTQPLDEKLVVDDISASGCSESLDKLPSMIQWHTGRPCLASTIEKRSQMWDGRVAVTVCGPLSMLTDVSNAVTSVQLDILSRRAKCTEMYLQTDAFDW